MRETSTSGAPLRPDASLATLFQDPFAQGDVRCLYDAPTQSFYFTEIGYPVATGPVTPTGDPLPLNTTADVVGREQGRRRHLSVRHLTGRSRCFGDQPKTGFDNNALVISTDEYCGANETEIEARSPSSSPSRNWSPEDATVNNAVTGPVSLAGNPVVGMDPAIGTGSSTAYFVNSVPFLANGTNNPVGNTLGLWTLTNTAAVTTGVGTRHPYQHGTAQRAVRLPGARHEHRQRLGHYRGRHVPITSETALNPDDSRLSGPVEVTRDSSARSSCGPRWTPR